MHEQELISWLREQVGRPIPGWMVKHLRDDGFLHAEDDAEREDLINRTRKLLPLAPSARSASQSGARLPQPSESELRNLAKHDVLRRDAMSEYWAKDASTRTEVKRFRSDVLGGRLLTDEEARRFLESPAASMFSVRVLRDRGVDPVRHTSRVVVEDASGATYCATVGVNRSATLEFSADGGQRDVWTTRMGGRPLRLVVWTGSALQDLRRVATTLNYPWQEGDESFILTGATPRLSALGHSFNVHLASHGNRAVINLHVEPWVSAERVTALYRDLQKAILRHRHNRPVSERRVTLFRFVTEHTNEDGETESWRKLLPEWNRRHKKWAYKNVRNFSRDYWAAARLLLFPSYNLNIGGGE